MDREEVLSEIIQLDLRMTREVLSGYKPHTEDKFKADRERLRYLRCKYFGQDSEYCKTKKEWGN